MGNQSSAWIAFAEGDAESRNQHDIHQMNDAFLAAFDSEGYYFHGTGIEDLARHDSPSSGAMDEFCVFSRALSIDEIRKLYSTVKSQADPVAARAQALTKAGVKHAFLETEGAH